MNGKIFIIFIFLFSGCAASYGCPAPKGIRCQRISDVYSSTQKSVSFPKQAKPLPEQRSVSFQDQNVDQKTIPLRTPPKILRVLIAPWIDQDGDLHKEGDLFLIVHTGEWSIGESIPKETAVQHKDILKAPLTPPLSPGDPNQNVPMPKVSPKEERDEP